MASRSNDKIPPERSKTGPGYSSDVHQSSHQTSRQHGQRIRRGSSEGAIYPFPGTKGDKDVPHRTPVSTPVSPTHPVSTWRESLAFASNRDFIQNDPSQNDRNSRGGRGRVPVDEFDVLAAFASPGTARKMAENQQVRSKPPLPVRSQRRSEPIRRRRTPKVRFKGHLYDDDDDDNVLNDDSTDRRHDSYTDEPPPSKACLHSIEDWSMESESEEFSPQLSPRDQTGESYPQSPSLSSNFLPKSRSFPSFTTRELRSGAPNPRKTTRARGSPDPTAAGITTVTSANLCEGVSIAGTSKSFRKQARRREELASSAVKAFMSTSPKQESHRGASSDTRGSIQDGGLKCTCSSSGDNGVTRSTTKPGPVGGRSGNWTLPQQESECFDNHKGAQREAQRRGSVMEDGEEDGIAYHGSDIYSDTAPSPSPGTMSLEWDYNDVMTSQQEPLTSQEDDSLLLPYNYLSSAKQTCASYHSSSGDSSATLQAEGELLEVEAELCVPYDVTDEPSDVRGLYDDDVIYPRKQNGHRGVWSSRYFDSEQILPTRSRDYSRRPSDYSSDDVITSDVDDEPFLHLPLLHRQRKGRTRNSVPLLLQSIMSKCHVFLYYQSLSTAQKGGKTIENTLEVYTNIIVAMYHCQPTIYRSI